MSRTADAPQVQDPPALRLEGLTVSRGRPVVREVSLEIPANSITALLGPNGAGKSSLVLAVGGVLRPSAGRVLVGEQDITRRRPEAIRAAGVAIVPEGRRLLGARPASDCPPCAPIRELGRCPCSRARCGHALPRLARCAGDVGTELPCL